MEKEKIKTLQESDGIAIGDYVRLKDTVLLNVEWEYNNQTNRMESKAYYTIFSEIATDEEYLNEELNKNKNGK